MVKLFKRLPLLIFFTLLLLGLYSVAVFAQSDTETITISEDFDSDYMRAGESLIFSGTVDGDLFLAGGMVRFEGETTGDLFIAGGQVVVKGKIGGNLRAAGGQVVVGGEIARNVMAFGGTVDLRDDTTVGGSLFTGTGNLDSEATFGKGATIFAGRSYLNGSFGGDVNLQGDEEVILGNNAQIAGDLNYTATKELPEDQAARVTGDLVYTPASESASKLAEISKGDFAKFSRTWRRVLVPIRFGGVLITLLVGWLWLKLANKSFLNISSRLRDKIAMSFLVGLASTILLPLVFLLLLITIIGIPIALALIAIVPLVLYLAKIVGSFVVGSYVLETLTDKNRRGWALLVGLLILFIAKMIPVVGFIYPLLLITAATGAILSTTWFAIRKKK